MNKEQRNELIEIVLTEVMHNEDRVAENGMKSFNMQPIYDFIEKVLSEKEKEHKEKIKEAIDEVWKIAIDSTSEQEFGILPNWNDEKRMLMAFNSLKERWQKEAIKKTMKQICLDVSITMNPLSIDSEVDELYQKYILKYLK